MRASAYSILTEGRKISLPLSGSFTIGRKAPDLSIARDKTLSRTQCRFLHHHGLLFVEDLGATNPTLLNGRPLSARSPAPVKVGDTIVAGSTLIEISGYVDQATKRAVSVTRPQLNPLVHVPVKKSFLSRLAIAAARTVLVVVIVTLALIKFESKTANPFASLVATASTTNTVRSSDSTLAKSFFEGALTSSDEFQDLKTFERQELLECISKTMLNSFVSFDTMIDAFNNNSAESQAKLKQAFGSCSNR